MRRRNVAMIAAISAGLIGGDAIHTGSMSLGHAMSLVAIVAVLQTAVVLLSRIGHRVTTRKRD
jgi:hypothetical protein